jgi:hypothetical protein
MAHPDGGEDPGWFTKSMLWALVPGFGIQRAMASPDGSALLLLRAMFTSVVMTLVAFGVVLALIAGGMEPDGTSTSVVAAGVAMIGALSLVLPRVVEQPLDCSSEGALVGGYRTRFFLRVAFAEAAALAGFVGAFLTGEAWMYLVGMPFTAVGFVRLAPTTRNIDRDQDALNQQGCGLSLMHLMVTSRPAPGTR